MKEIIHIVGLNNEYKENFKLNILKIDPNYNIIDIDDITQKINNDKKINKLYDEYEKNKLDKHKSKKIADDINNEWARELQLKLNKLLNLAEKNTILIGLTTSVINNGKQKIHITLPTNYKFIIDIDLEENAKHIIKNNLKEYKNEIINGKFPLEYLNLTFLIRRREQLNTIYTKNLYILKKSDDILKFLKDNLQQNNTNKSKKLYIASDIEYSKSINIKNITLYEDEVIAILKLLKLDTLEYNKNNKTLKELEKDSLKELDKDCYVYEITELNNIFFDGDNFKNNKRIKINKGTYVDNIYLILQKLGIKFIKFS